MPARSRPLRTPIKKAVILPRVPGCPGRPPSAAADHAILDLYCQDVIGVQAVGHVLKAWEEPPHDWGARTAWRLFNAATLALAGKVAERPDLTKHLHQVIDGVCETVH